MTIGVEKIVETPRGKLRGMHRHGMDVFRGIRFATARRWARPEAVKPWAGVADATVNGPIAPQTSSRIAQLLGASMEHQGEDCLSLNIWTPACDDHKRPVMVWFHGGAFVFGSGSSGIYNGRYLTARSNHVIVTVNYRLGALGFLNLNDITNGRVPATGTEGLSDQLMALQWVKENIACFGGDPGNVTVFGESAGAMSIATLMSMPASKGLFKRAITQSGAAHVGHPRDRSTRVAARFLRHLGIAPARAEQLYDVPANKLMQVQTRIILESRESRDAGHLGRMPFQPCLDDVILTEPPIRALRKGAAKNVALLTGTTAEEWKLFSGLLPHLRAMSKRRLETRARMTFGDLLARELLLAHDEGSSFDRFNAMMTHKVFTEPSTRLADAQMAAGAPVHAYRFDYKSPLLGLGACHALELGFVFGTHHVSPVNRFFGSGEAVTRLSHLMMDAWANFAESGAPQTAETGAWPVLGKGPRQVMRFHPDAALLSDPLPQAARTWALTDDVILGP